MESADRHFPLRCPDANAHIIARALQFLGTTLCYYSF